MQTRAERMKAVEDKIASVKALVKQKYNMDLSTMRVRYDLKGRTAGWALGGHTIRLNTTAIFGDEAHFKDMVNDTVPHEIAHIVCHRNPALGHKHDFGWATVCRALGGTGKRTHDMTTIEYARGRTYIYTTSMGKEYAVSERRHRSVQSGGVLRFRKASWGYIDSNCAYTVKLDGRVISTHPAKHTPVVKTGTSRGLLLDIAAAVAPANTSFSGFLMPAGTKVVDNRKPAPSTGTSYAEQVRVLIRAAKAAGHGQDHVFRQAVNTLGMKATSARNCIKFNWDRV